LPGTKQRKVVHVEQKELANWLPAVQSHFDERFCPKLLLNLPVPTDGEVVIALYFETDRAPYVVKNPSFNKPHGGPVQYEVPWREGNSTRSAVRVDLLRVLLKAVKRPLVEVRRATMTFSSHSDGVEKWNFEVELYGVPKDNSPVVFPSHKWYGEFHHVFTGQMVDLEIRPKVIPETANGSASFDQILCLRPMGFTMIGERTFRAITRSLPDDIDANICLGIAGEDNISVDIDLKMGNMKQQTNGTFIWSQGDWKRRKRKLNVGIV
jgi:hypothetical protein